MVVGKPTRRQVQPAGHQAVALIAGVADEDPGLAGVDFPAGPAVLAGHADGLGPLLGELAAVDREHGVRGRERLGQEGLVGRGHRRVVPAVRLHEALEGPDRIGVQERQGDGFDGLGGLGTQEPGQMRPKQAWNSAWNATRASASPATSGSVNVMPGTRSGDHPACRKIMCRSSPFASEGGGR